MHYYQFNIGDYASSTQHLDPIEDIAYRRMLDLYYSKESPLPKDIDKIARLIRMRSHQDSIAIVLEEFFCKEKDGYHNKGANKALEKVYKKSEAAKKSAEARWSKNKDLDVCERNANASETQCENNADGMLPNTQYPIPNTQDKDLLVSSETKRSKFKFSDEDMRFAKEMFSRVLVVNPSTKKPSFDNWANTIRLMRESDNRNHTEMWKVFSWANKDSFWCSNILSPVKLRKQFDKLTVKANETNKQTNPPTGGNAQQRVADALAQQRAEFYGSSENMGSDDFVLYGQVDEQERGDALIDLDNRDWSSK